MKGPQVHFFILLAGVAVILGLIAKFSATKIFVNAFTWLEVAQTCLLFSIAFGLGQLFSKAVKE
ncbi:MAG: hypothetical protein Kow0098_22180 [Ignavibacteriaceae bacterium]